MTAPGGTAALHVRGIVLPAGRERDVFAAGGRITLREPVEA